MSEIMNTIDETEMEKQENKKKQQTKAKEHGGTEAIVKGWEFVVHLSFNNYL